MTRVNEGSPVRSGLVRVSNRRVDLDEASHYPRSGMIPKAESPMTMCFLGFDASCGSCADIATEVDTIAAGRIQIFSLQLSCILHPASCRHRMAIDGNRGMGNRTESVPASDRIDGFRPQAGSRATCLSFLRSSMPAFSIRKRSGCSPPRPHASRSDPA